MKGNLPILPLVLLCCLPTSARAQSPVGVAAAPNAPSPAETKPGAAAPNDSRPLLAKAIGALEAYESISAKLRQRIDLFGQQLVGSGSYLQGPAKDHQLRLELRIHVGDEVSTLQHVSDGRTLWIYQQLFDEGRVSKVDLRRVLAALAQRDGTPPPGPVVNWFSMGGLPRLLWGLDRYFEFEAPVADQLGELPVWKLRGTWRRGHLVNLLPAQREAIEAGQPADLGQLPEYLPHEVVLYLGQGDLFPYKLEYRRADTSKKKPLPSFLHRPRTQTLLTLEIFEVRIDGPLDPQSFVYRPSGQNVRDGTADYLKLLGLK